MKLKKRFSANFQTRLEKVGKVRVPIPNLFHLPRTSPDSCFSQNKSTGTFVNLFEYSNPSNL